MKFLILLLSFSLLFSQDSFSKLDRKRFKIIKQIGQQYKHSEIIDTKEEYLELRNSINKYSKKNKLPDYIIYGIFETESDFRYKLKHKYVVTSTYKHGKWARRGTHAIGAGGVIFYSNPHILKKMGLKENDLYQIKYNVAATCAILRYKIDAMSNRKRYKNIKLSYNKKLRLGLRAYYGAGSSYVNKVIKKSRKYK